MIVKQKKMLNNNEILALYEANKVQGRSHLDPRKGFYKIVSVYQGICFTKPATLATVKWKQAETDVYFDTTLVLQLETLKTGLNPLDTTNIIGREIKITSAIWHPMVPLFCVKWELLEEKSYVKTLRDLLASGATFSLDDFESDDVENWEEY